MIPNRRRPTLWRLSVRR